MARSRLLGRFLGLPEAPEERAAVGASILTATDGRDILFNEPDGWEVSAPWLWFTGPSGGDGTGGPFGNPPPGADGVNGLVSIPAVTRCTSIICNTIAGLPWRVFNGYSQLPTPDWITDPQSLRPDGRITGSTPIDGRLSAVEFWAQWLVSALWFGDGFVYAPNRDALGAPKPPMWILHPQDVDLDSRAGDWIDGGEADGYGYWVGAVRIPDDHIMHLRGEPPYSKGRGTGIIDRHGADLLLAATVRSYAGSIYSSGVPAGYLKVNAPNVTKDQAEDLKTRWMRNHGNARKSIAVLNATTDFHALSVSPIDAALGDSRQWSLRDIALAFGVPPYMLGVPGDSSTYANVESRMTELQTFTLLPWMRRIESTLDAQFPRGTELKIQSEGTLRADPSTRYASYSAALSAGWLTVDEVRALEDRPPLPEQVSTDPVNDELPPIEPEPDTGEPEPAPVEESVETV